MTARAPEQRRYTITDETLRDGLQSPKVLQPSIEQSLILFALMKSSGIEKADIGFANSNPLTRARVLEVAKLNLQEGGSPMEVSCAARTMPGDITPIIEISQQIGSKVGADTFIGTDPDRIKAEGWSLAQMVKNVEDTTRYAVEHGVPTMIVTETSFIGIERIPNTVRQIYLAALNAGANRVCLCDTTGVQLPFEIARGVRWMRKLLDSHGFKDVGIDFHAHNDSFGAVPNTIEALRAGADRGHATIFGVGERAGNASLIPVLLQMDRLGMGENHNLKILPAYAFAASEALGIPIPDDEPGVGKDSLTMTSGVHAASVLKALRKNVDGASGVYLAFDYAKKMGIKPSHSTNIGQQAGEANVRLWCFVNELPEPTQAQVERVLSAAKQQDQRGFLTDKQILRLLIK